MMSLSEIRYKRAARDRTIGIAIWTTAAIISTFDVIDWMYVLQLL